MRTTTKNVSITHHLIISIMYHTLVFLTYAINLPARLQLHMCIQRFREGQVTLTCKGYSAIQVRSEMSPSSQISPTSYQCCVLKQNESKTQSRLVLKRLRPIHLWRHRDPLLTQPDSPTGPEPDSKQLPMNSMSFRSSLAGAGRFTQG